MMQSNTGIKILKRFAPMIVKDQKSQSVSRRLPKSQRLGERKISVEPYVIQPLPMPSEVASWYGPHVSDVEKKNPLLIMKIMTNLLKLCGFANRAINNDTKKY